jgi:epoxyqueuosine reductase
LGYFESYLEKRLHPEQLLEGAKSVIAVMMNYYPQDEIPGTNNFIISKYAYGRDYHLLMRERLGLLMAFLKSITADLRGRESGDSGPDYDLHARAFVDSGPVLEKAWAQRCGLGWQGKNTLVIHPLAGSFFFIGIILTNLELEPDAPESDHCGSCEKCIKACPTEALDIPYQLDIRRCISYLTIESKEEIPVELKGKLKDRIYGCDICQDICPYNRFAVPSGIPEFAPSEPLMQMRKKEWLSLTEADFDRMFAATPVKRMGYARLMRNIRAASQ